MWGFFDVLLGYFAIYLSSLWSKFKRYALRRRPLREIHFEKRNFPTWSFRLVSWESSDQTSRKCVKFITLLNRSKKAHSRKNELRSFFLLLKFSQQFTSLGDHTLSYVNTLRNYLNHRSVLQSLRRLSAKTYFAGNSNNYQKLVVTYRDRPFIQFCWMAVLILTTFFKHKSDAEKLANRMRAAKIA